MRASAELVLECRGLTKRYGERTLVDDVGFTVGAGETARMRLDPPEEALCAMPWLWEHRRMRKYVIVGVQGSGKGTPSKLLAVAFDLVHLSVGDIFRWNVQQDVFESICSALGPPVAGE